MDVTYTEEQQARVMALRKAYNNPTRYGTITQYKFSVSVDTEVKVFNRATNPMSKEVGRKCCDFIIADLQMQIDMYQELREMFYE